MASNLLIQHGWCRVVHNENICDAKACMAMLVQVVNMLRVGVGHGRGAIPTGGASGSSTGGGTQKTCNPLVGAARRWSSCAKLLFLLVF